MKKILVRAPNWIGDQVLSFEFFSQLRKQNPDAHILSVCVPWVSDLQFRKLVDQVYILPHSQEHALGKRFQVLSRAAKEVRKLAEWDEAVTLPNSFSSALFLKLTNAKVRRGFATEGRSLFLNQRVSWESRGKNFHRAKAYCQLLANPDFPENGSVFRDAEQWPGIPRLVPKADPLWILAPGATANSRRWPLDRFIELARQVRENLGWHGVVVGGKAEAPLAQEIISRLERGMEDWTCRGPLPSLSEVFRRAKLFVGNESGLAHFASLMGTPTYIVCGAADPRRTAPVGRGVVRIRTNPIECWPCEKNNCPLEDEAAVNQCLKGISTESVVEEVFDFVKELGGSGEGMGG